MATNLTEFFRESAAPYLALIKAKITTLETDTHVHPNLPVLDTLTDNQVALDGKFALKADLVGGKVPASQLPDAVVGAMTYQGTWDAGTPTPASPEQGHYYVVNAAGNTNVAGKTDLSVGDYIVYDGTAWGFIDNTDALGGYFQP